MDDFVPLRAFSGPDASVGSHVSSTSAFGAGSGIGSRTNPGAASALGSAHDSGVGDIGGVRRTTRTLRVRLTKFKLRQGCKASLSSVKLLRTGATTAMNYGQGALGVSPIMMRDRLPAVVRTMHESSVGGNLQLLTVDGRDPGSVDPGFQALG